MTSMKNTPGVNYKDQLSPTCREIKICNGIDPYHLDPSLLTGGIETLPEVRYPDIVNYFINGQNPYTLEEMKVYKSLDTCNYFLSRWVSHIAVLKLKQCTSLVMGKVKHSQWMNEPPLHSWGICEENGTVLRAHYKCMAGLSESCSQLGALFLAVEAGVKLRDSKTVTQEKAYWKVPNCKKVKFETIQRINFTSAKRKRTLESSVTEHTPTQKVKKKTIPLPRPEELTVFRRLD